MREERLKRGLTLQALADLCKERGVNADDSNLSKIERGRHMPYPPLRAALAEILDLDINLQPKPVAHS